MGRAERKPNPGETQEERLLLLKRACQSGPSAQGWGPVRGAGEGGPQRPSPHSPRSASASNTLPRRIPAPRGHHWLRTCAQSYVILATVLGDRYV